MERRSIEISLSGYCYLGDYIDDLTCELPSGHPVNKEEAEGGGLEGRWRVRVCGD